METVKDFIFLVSKITTDGDCSPELKDTCSLEKSYDKPWQNIKKQRHYFAKKVTYSQICGFTNSHGKTDSESLDSESGP